CAGPTLGTSFADVVASPRDEWPGRRAGSAVARPSPGSSTMATADTFRSSTSRIPHAYNFAPGDEPPAAVNVGDAERMASNIGGGTLVALGLWRGGFGGLGLAALGGALIYRGVTGHCSLYRAIGADTAGPGDDIITGGVPARQGVRVEESVTINRPA